MTAQRALSTCWVVTDGKAGMESQCIGLAEALGLSPVVKRVALRAPWKQLSPYLRIGNAYAYSSKSDPLTPPWPDLLIATGRSSVAASLHIREQSRRDGHPTITVQVQDPVIATRHFDLVVTPQHDRLEGANVVSTLGALHGITAAKLAPEAEKLMTRIPPLPRPIIGVLLGGPNSAYRFGLEEAANLGAALAAGAKSAGASLLVTPSRRTGEDNMAVLRSAIADVPHYIWDETGDNPYFGILGLADQLVVTCDSVNMVSEAVASGKPVHVFELPGGSVKFRRFHHALLERGLTRTFSGSLEPYEPGEFAEDMTRVAEAVRRIAAER